MCDISIREYICWLPDAASEPTSTIVLTTPNRRFVDIRIIKPSSPDDAAEDGIPPLSRVDWAIAGTSSSTVVPSNDDPTKQVKHGRWNHWIDSRTANTDGVADEGDMFDDPSDASLTLEKGRMVNPATGAETDYEEMWRSEPIQDVPVPGGGDTQVTCLVLQWDGGDGDMVQRGLIVRLGQYCQAFARDGDSITLERLKWDAGQRRWTRQVRVGEQELPTDMATYVAHEARIDDEVRVGGVVWKVVEKA